MGGDKFMMGVFIIHMVLSWFSLLVDHLTSSFLVINLAEQLNWRWRGVFFELFLDGTWTGDSIVSIGCSGIVFIIEIRDIVLVAEVELVLEVFHQCWSHTWRNSRNLILFKSSISLNCHFYSWICWKSAYQFFQIFLVFVRNKSSWRVLCELLREVDRLQNYLSHLVWDCPIRIILAFHLCFSQWLVFGISFSRVDVGLVSFIDIVVVMENILVIRLLSDNGLCCYFLLL